MANSSSNPEDTFLSARLVWQRVKLAHGVGNGQPSFSHQGIRTIMPMMREQADMLIAALKRDVGHGGSTYIDVAWL